MKLRDILTAVEADIVTGEALLDREVKWCYCSDLLSDVMANSVKDSVWITLQTHPNIVAVASLVGLSGILISRGAAPDPETVSKAAQENVAVLTTKLPTFEAAGKLYVLLSK